MQERWEGGGMEGWEGRKKDKNMQGEVKEGWR
jgi:hypothetical protein